MRCPWQVGTRIEYDGNGAITAQTAVAREVGTTVTVSNLFASMPVRFKELQRNIKREYARLLKRLQAYVMSEWPLCAPAAGAVRSEPPRPK